ncbi:uncharacterized protein LOC134194190 [Corticium candelabrum]|uniref:uncharacterized protein LOC134194190 n=1 Tax=Corticium candelabrum TaxID=121492 RepID=UPI002E263790|nr:uncharacterized protein LOC134194190 [Corticium candelabrum]
MARLTLFCVLLFCVFGTTMAFNIKSLLHKFWKPNDCDELVSRNCFDVCGKGHCPIKSECCHKFFSYFRLFCKHELKFRQRCLPFVCKNNGTLLRTQDRHHGHKSLCDDPTLKCACPTGYSGACCQSHNTEAPTNVLFETSRPSDFFHETDSTTEDTMFKTEDTVFTTEDAVFTDSTRGDNIELEAKSFVYETGNPDISTDSTTEDTMFKTEDTVFTTEDAVFTDSTRGDNIELEATSFVYKTGNPDISTDSTTEEAVTDEPATIY